MNLLDQIPAKARKWVYGLLGTAAAIEAALDLVGWGVVDGVLESKLVTVLTALGFGMAFKKTTDVVVVRD